MNLNCGRTRVATKRMICVALLLVSINANADWHGGTVRFLGFGYDGQSLVFQITGLTKTACTCYSPWPDGLCVSRTRQDFKEVYALLLKARATNEPINVNIDENTCSVVALYESE